VLISPTAKSQAIVDCLGYCSIPKDFQTSYKGEF
jgi:hypothetical protein